MKVLIIGSGGREHALAWKAAQSSLVDQVFVAPGNAGTASEPLTTNVDIATNETDRLVAFVNKEDVGLTIVGPEMPLADGIADEFSRNGLACFGPSRKASQIESSKLFAKAFMDRHGIPMARYRSFSDASEASRFIDTVTSPVVIKADGLAAGKGVIIARNCDEAKFAVHQILVGKRFGKAGERIVIEEFLEGEEASFICMVDGKNIIEMATSQDHKAAYDGDEGPNTGGMGAYSPASVIDESMQTRILNTIIRPTVDGLREEGIEYKGFLYAGIMIGTDGQPRVLEFNCRFGDPETQPIMMRLKSDLVEHCMAGVEGGFGDIEAQWDPRASLGVVAVAGGYPGEYVKGSTIEGLDLVTDPDVKVFHAGTTTDSKGELAVNGGRVLCVTAIADDIAKAQDKAYESLKFVSFEYMHYRSDIGHRAVARQ